MNPCLKNPSIAKSISLLTMCLPLNIDTLTFEFNVVVLVFTYLDFYL